jgi:hypothetical protein
LVTKWIPVYGNIALELKRTGMKTARVSRFNDLLCTFHVLIQGSVTGPGDAHMLTSMCSVRPHTVNQVEDDCSF